MVKWILFLIAANLVFLSCNKEDEFPLTSDFEGKFVFIGSTLQGMNFDEVFTLDKVGMNQITYDDTIGYAKYDPIWVKNAEYIQYEKAYTCLCPSFGRNKIIRADGSDLRDFNISAISPNAHYGVQGTYKMNIFKIDENLNAEWIDSIDGNISFKPARWSPDSDNLLYITGDGTGETLAKYNVLTRLKSNLFSYDEIYFGITDTDWSYMGDKVAFVWNDDVYIVNADGTNVQNLTSSSNKEYEIAWSPTADVLAYSQRTLDEKMENIILHNFADSTEQQLDLVEPLHNVIYQMHWSIDGKNIAFSAGSDHYGIFIIDKEGTNLKQVYDEYVSDFDWYTE